MFRNDFLLSVVHSFRKPRERRKKQTHMWKKSLRILLLRVCADVAAAIRLLCLSCSLIHNIHISLLFWIDWPAILCNRRQSIYLEHIFTMIRFGDGKRGVRGRGHVTATVHRLIFQFCRIFWIIFIELCATSTKLAWISIKHMRGLAVSALKLPTPNWNRVKTCPAFFKFVANGAERKECRLFASNICQNVRQNKHGARV